MSVGSFDGCFLLYKSHKTTVIGCSRFLQKTTKKWLHLLEDSGIPFGPINDVEQVFDDPQVQCDYLVFKLMRRADFEK